MASPNEIANSFPFLQGLQILAIGGQKEVFAAVHKNSGRRVVLKLIKPHSLSDERTQREILAHEKLDVFATLKSRHYPELLDHGDRVLAGETTLYTIEQFIDGETYQNILARQPKQPLRAVVGLADALLTACVDFEKVRLVHRDITPNNILVEPSGHVWVIDFGLARHLDQPSITPNGQYRWAGGTPGFGAAEQYRNEKALIDSRTDLFSIGVVVYEALAGFNPYLARTKDPLQILRLTERQDLPPLAVPEDARGEFTGFIACLTQRYVTRRPPSAHEARAWFGQVRRALGL